MSIDESQDVTLPDHADHAPDDIDHPTQIGPYKILQVLGEGGMGVVYEAAQSAPVARRVALKILKLGMDTKQVVARFDTERQALAVMDHPNIAKVFDGGATDAGRPYFVMECVKGVPITEYCDLHKLATHDRLELFVKLCQAVQHAHQKGVLHRDLKPSNILVTLADGEPAPKVIDFGIAKAIGHSLTDMTLVTQIGHPVGTPAYMSPEQAEMSGLDVDTRTDIYSLGVILYELLTGTLPFDPHAMVMGSMVAQHILRQSDTQTPSARLDSLGAGQAKVAASRKTDVSSLKRQLKGDLDWIVLKAMDKDRTRRYETANGLGMDIQRYLADEPIVARPPSAAYRLGKFARRHRTAVAASVAVIAALVVGALLATVGMIRATRAETAAQREAETARQVSDFLVGLFEVSNPSQARGNTITAREILDAGAEQIDRELSDQPVVKARMFVTMGKVYTSLGLYPEARPLLEEALSIQERSLGSNHEEVAQSLEALAGLRQVEGNYEEAEALLRRRLSVTTAPRGSGDSAAARALTALGSVLVNRGNYDEADSLYRAALAIQERTLGANHPDVASTLRMIAWLHDDNRTEADSLYRRILRIEETALGLDHPRLGDTYNDVGLLYLGWGIDIVGDVPDSAQRQFAKAEDFLQRSLSIRTTTLGPDHPTVATSLVNLAEVHERLGKYERAEDDAQRALAIQESTLAPDNPDIAFTLDVLGNTYREQGRYDAAETTYQRALTLRESSLGSDHLLVARTLYNLARLYDVQDVVDRAARTYERALAIQESVMGIDYPTTRETIRDYSALLRRSGHAGDAAALERRLAIAATR